MHLGVTRTALTLVASVVAAAWGTLLAEQHMSGRASTLDRIEYSLTDWLYAIAGPRLPPSNVLIVAIDDDTITAAGQYPLPRSTVARLVGEIPPSEPKAIALDILFLGPGPPEAALALARALQQAHAVVGAAALFARGGETTWSVNATLGEVPVAERALWPINAVR